jgi:hypothetical protein
MHLCMRRQLRIDAGATQQSKRQLGLREQFVPQMEREVFVDATQPGNEVILERADRAFGRIAPM